MQEQLYELVGRLAIYAFLAVLVLLVVAAVLLVVSLRRHRFHFPNFTIAVLLFFQGFFKAVFRLLRLDDTAIDQLYVDLTLKVRERDFFRVPPRHRAVFFPQCLRSLECPARLTPEGIICERCGRCRLGEARSVAEGLGYRFFIVPGSTFVARCVRKYRPQAVLGIGCLVELKDGGDMIQRLGVPSYGVQLERAGCIATSVDWEWLYEVLRRYDEGARPAGKRVAGKRPRAG